MRQQNGTPAAPPSEDGMAQALEDYLAAAEAGTAPPRDEFLARYPQLAEDLDACLAALHFIGRAAEGPRSVVAEVAGAVPPEQAPGQLGDFRLIREVGRGGMGVVYEAEQVSLGRRVALKVLPFAATMDPRQLQRFHNEARAAASLHHPNIVPVYAVGEERAVHFYAMQFIAGQTLAAMIADLRQRGGGPALPEVQPTTPHVPGQPEPAAEETAPRAAASTARAPRDRAHFRRVAELGIQAAEALDHAHALGIVHRDVKPANLLVDGRGGLWVADFGLAHIQSDARLTMTGDLVGTLRYMSPEQALAKRVVVDHRTDVYSLGATLYELLTLEPAFSGLDRQELLRQIAFEEPKTPRRVNRAIPAELETIVLKAMEKNPADRYATAKELAEDLRRFLADEPIRARPAGVVRRLRKWGRRHPAMVAAAAAALTAAVAVLSGGIGWVASDRARRREATEQGLAAAWEESLSWQRQRRLPEALSAARRAAGLAAGGEATEARRRQMGARVADLELLERLENVRLEYASSHKEAPDGFDRFDNELADGLYRDAFRQAALDVQDAPAIEVGAQVRGTTVPAELAAALDDWAYVRLGVCDAADPVWRHLLQVARVADPDPWRTRLREELERRDRAGLLELSASEQVFHLLPGTLLCLAHALRNEGAPERALALMREGQRRHPGDFWFNEDLGLTLKSSKPPDLDGAIRFYTAAVAIRPSSRGAHTNLGNALTAKGRPDEAIAEFQEGLAIGPNDAPAHDNLGFALSKKGDIDGAIIEYQTAILLNQNCASAHNHLGNALRGKGNVDGAIAEFRKAIDIKNNYFGYHFNLGNALRARGDADEAIAEFRTAVKLNKEFAEAHINLGTGLHARGEVDEAIAEYRAAIRADPDGATGHYDLGNALYTRGDLDEAIAELRTAVRLKHDYAKAHNNLGSALAMTGNLDGAIAAFRQAIQLEPDRPQAHCNLGLLLRDNGRFAEALTNLRRGHELASKLSRQSHPTGQWVKECERLVELEPKLPAILSGKEAPANPAERADYASLCQKKRLYASAARLYREALAAKPGLASAANGLRYDAACVAAKAGCGAGDDAAQLTDAERAGFRKQALDWLRADLDAWRRLLDKEPDKARPVVAQKMQHWLGDADFNGVRGPDALGQLPEAERNEWQKLWADVADTLAKARGKTPPEQTPGAK